MITVAFVVYGIHTKQGAIFHQHCLDNTELYHAPIDIRRLLHKDPLKKKRRYSVSHKENGTSTSTQVALLDDPSFFDACVHIVDTILVEVDEYGEVPTILPVYWTAGQHRADTAVEGVCNKVLNAAHDHSGDRMYNAKVFKCNSVFADSVVEVVGQNAEAWLAKPFCVAAPTEFGEAAREAHARANTQLLWLEDLRELVETNFAHHGKYIDRKTRKPFEHIDDEVGRSQRQPRARTPMRKRSRSPSRTRHRSRAMADQPTPPSCPPPSHREPHSRPDERDRDNRRRRASSSDQRECPCCKGSSNKYRKCLNTVTENRNHQQRQNK